MSKENTPDEEQFNMLQSLFDELYEEISLQSKKKPDAVMNDFKVSRVNRVLTPLQEMMKAEPYYTFLEIIPAPTEEKTGRTTVTNGLTYSDVSLVLSQYKSATNQFYQKYFSLSLGL